MGDPVQRDGDLRLPTQRWQGLPTREEVSLKKQLLMATVKSLDEYREVCQKTGYDEDWRKTREQVYENLWRSRNQLEECEQALERNHSNQDLQQRYRLFQAEFAQRTVEVTAFEESIRAYHEKTKHAEQMIEAFRLQIEEAERALSLATALGA